MVTELLTQAMSATAHSSLFFANIPRKFQFLPSWKLSGHKFNTCIPKIYLINREGSTSTESINQIVDFSPSLPLIRLAFEGLASGSEELSITKLGHSFLVALPDGSAAIIFCWVDFFGMIFILNATAQLGGNYLHKLSGVTFFAWLVLSEDCVVESGGVVSHVRY